jgi:hypothetical protein
MGLHHRYYADDIDYSPTPRTQPYAEMQKQIGKILREQYQPPQELPHQLLVLLLKVDQQGSRRKTPPAILQRRLLMRFFGPGL